MTTEIRRRENIRQTRYRGRYTDVVVVRWELWVDGAYVSTHFKRRDAARAGARIEAEYRFAVGAFVRVRDQKSLHAGRTGTVLLRERAPDQSRHYEVRLDHFQQVAFFREDALRAEVVYG